jgi:hypothetical protein
MSGGVVRKLLIPLLIAVSGAAHGGDLVSADRLTYRILSEGNKSPQINRILVTEGYVRFDDGSGADGFLLYDRKNKVIFSVNPEERLILEIAPKPVNLSPGGELKVEVRKTVDDKAPSIAGSKPIEVELLANGKSCEKRIVAAGPMKRALDGLREYQQTLAYQQYISLEVIPTDMETDCDLALNIYYSERMLQEGLAVQRWREGLHEELVDYAEGEQVSRDLFQLPEDFGRKVMPGAK